MPTIAPIIPFTFEPTSKDFEDHLTYTDDPTGRTVGWALAGVSFKIPTVDDDWTASRDEIAAANPGLVTLHRDKGVSIGPYHEFLLSEESRHDAGFRFGKFEVTFGQATPLMAYLFNDTHREKYFGEWSYIRSVRIVGAQNAEEAEIAFCNAAMKYEDKYKVHPRLVEMNQDDLFNEMAVMEDAELAAPEMFQEGPPVRDIEPVRFYYSGLAQSEHAGGCLAFYRVLEYYAFLSNSQALNKLRNDHSVSDGDFARKVLQLVAINEKGPILALINKLTDDALLKHVNVTGLVKAASATALGEEVYKFRNSIVHGKDSQGYLLHSTSVFDDGPDMMLWRTLLRTLAKAAIERYGVKLI